MTKAVVEIPDQAEWKEVQAIVDAMKKKFGKKNMFSWGSLYEQAVGVPTGSIEFDAATTIGGWPTGRIIEIMGPESSGKTSWSLYILKQLEENFPADKRPIAIIDLEHSIDTSLVAKIGLKNEELLYIYPDTAEQALGAWLDLNASGTVKAVLLDSVDALVSEKTMAKDIGDADMQGTAKLMSRILRQGSKTCIQNNVTNIFINQQRDSLSMFGAKKTTPGGNALKYYASMRIETMTQKPSTTVPNAFMMTVKLKKNKCGPPCYTLITFDFLYGIGPDPVLGLVRYAKSIGLIRSAQKKYYLIKETGETEISTTGLPNAVKYLRENVDAFDQLRTDCVALFTKQIGNVAPEEEEDEPPEE